MIHPEVDPVGEQNFTKQMLNKKYNKLELFYSVGLAMVFANIIPFLTAKNTDERAVSDSSRDWQMIYFYTTSFILSVPLLLEFCFDSVIGSLYPAYDRNLVEHKIGHFMILFSLAAPLVLVIGAMTTEDESVFNPLFEKCFISGCQCLAFVAIYGTLQVTDKSHWKMSNSGLIVALFFGSQITMNFAISPDTTSRDCHLDVPEAVISLSLLVLTLIAHLVASRHFLSSMVYAVVDGTGWTGGPFKSDRFTTAILISLITIFLIVRTVLTIIAVANSDDYNLPAATATTLLTNVIFALIAVALPGRMIRRGMVALKHEMESKKTFIRYISHEIRSPLSTTSLGLDYLIDQMSTSKRPLTAETILEVVKDARVSCELATNTLNDLLMFDKIETGMLELSAVECDAWEFVTSCVKPFQLQALCAGVAIHTTQIVSPVEPTSGLDATSSGNRSAIDLEAQLLTAVNNGHDLKKDNKKDVFNANSSSNRLCAVQVDRYKMEQVLRNFLTNALKFTPQHCNGSIAVNMSVLPSFTADTMSVNGEAATSPKQSSTRQSSTRDKYSPSTRRGAGGGATATNSTAAVTAVEEGEEAVLRVEVVDTGPGISVENLPKLFGQYVQFDATTLQGGKGSGLGLWLSKAIVEMHGGVIGASSLGVGQGCTFYFELPCRVLLDAPTQHQLQTDLTVTNTSSAGVAFTPVSRKLGPIKHSGELTVCDEIPFVRPEPALTRTFSQKLPPNFMIPPPVLIPFQPPQQQLPLPQQEVDSTVSLHNQVTTNVTSNNTNLNINNNNNSNNNISTTNNKCNDDNNSSEVATFRISPAALRASVAPSPKTHVYSRAKHRGLLNASSGSISSAGTTERGSMRISGERTSMRSHRSHSPHSYSSLRSKGSLSTGHQTYNPIDASQVLVGLRVLLVDDSALARKMVERSLVSAECSVHHAQNGLEGVQKVQQSLQPGETPYDVVVIDCYMPVMNGPEAVSIMRGSECGFKGVIFAVTGASTNEEFSVGGAPGLGVDCVMVKPFNMETFRKTVFELKPASSKSAQERLNQVVRTVHIG